MELIKEEEYNIDNKEMIIQNYRHINEESTLTPNNILTYVIDYFYNKCKDIFSFYNDYFDLYNACV